MEIAAIVPDSGGRGLDVVLLLFLFVRFYTAIPCVLVLGGLLTSGFASASLCSLTTVGGVG